MPIRKILYVGSLKHSDTSQHRMLAMKKLGYEVFTLDTNEFIPSGRLRQYVQHRYGIGKGIADLNRACFEQIEELRPDLVWVDKGTMLKKDTLIRSKTITKFVHINPDDPFGLHRAGWRLFLQALPYYDVHFVSRPQNIAEYRLAGARNVFEYDRSFSVEIHRPFSEEEMVGLTPIDVGFIGSFAQARSEAIEYLWQNGLSVAVFGSGWKPIRYPRNVRHLFHPPMTGLNYAKAINRMKIALHFLRRENRDEQDSRTFEIPACGVFMLAERSRKHEQLFNEDVECVFFDSKEELLTKIKYYLANAEARQKIAAAGYRKSIEAGYDHQSRIQQMILLAESVLK